MNNNSKNKPTRTALNILQWVLIAAAYSYLAYKLLTFNGWQTLTEHFAAAGTKQYAALGLAIALFPLNILFESLKWQYLVKDIEPMSVREAQRQTYFGFIGAFLTPSRIGDYPARVTMMRDKSRWLEAITLGFVGSLALAFLQVLVGMPSMLVLLEKVGGFRVVEWLCIAILLLQILAIVFYPTVAAYFAGKTTDGKVHNTLLTLSQFSHKQFFITLLYSLFRYLVFCFQLYLVMTFCGIQLSIVDALIAIPAYYLLVTITPSVPIADAAVRGSWSVVIFGVFTDNVAAIAIAAVLLWMLNTILPMLVGTCYRKK